MLETVAGRRRTRRCLGGEVNSGPSTKHNVTCGLFDDDNFHFLFLYKWWIIVFLLLGDWLNQRYPSHPFHYSARQTALRLQTSLVFAKFVVKNGRPLQLRCSFVIYSHTLTQTRQRFCAENELLELPNQDSSQLWNQDCLLSSCNVKNNCSFGPSAKQDHWYDFGWDRLAGLKKNWRHKQINMLTGKDIKTRSYTLI